jgi:hypothetical protein
MAKWTKLAVVGTLCMVMLLVWTGGALALTTLHNVGNRVWADDGDGIQEVGERGLNGVKVTLTGLPDDRDPGDELTLETTTGPASPPASTPSGDTFDGNGWYNFQVPAGSYTITVSNLPAGSVQTYDYDGLETANTASFKIVLSSRYDIDFGYTVPPPPPPPTYELGDRVWNDADNSGGPDDETEPGIEGVIVKLTGMGREETVVTDQNGNYLFSGLEAGTYTVEGVGGAGTPVDGHACTYDLSGAPDGVATVTIADANSYDVDFSYYKPVIAAKVSISGFVVNDSNANGAIDAGEPVLAGPTIKLLDFGGATVAVTSAAADGSFLFSNLDVGIYQVVETNLPDYRSTNAIGGTDGTRVDNDTILVNATTPGSSYPNQDFLDTGTKPDIDLIKTGPSCAKRGDTVTYHFKITNTGNTWLYGGVTLYDPMLGGNVWHKTPVAPGEINEFDVKYTIPLSGSLTNGTYQAPSNLQTLCSTPTPPAEEKLVNTATAIGCPPGGLGNVTDTSSWTITVGLAEVRPYTTYTQGGWGARPSGNNPGTVLRNNWSKVYGNRLTIGSCKTLSFSGSSNVADFLPQGGSAGRLNRSYCNPTSRTSAGVFAGQVLALRLNVDFSNAGVTRPGLAGLKIQSGTYRGWTVAQFLLQAEKVLGASASFDSALNDTATKINESFDNGTTNTGYIK